jgi:hypothetical protein
LAVKIFVSARVLRVPYLAKSWLETRNAGLETAAFGLDLRNDAS